MPRIHLNPSESDLLKPSLPPAQHINTKHNIFNTNTLHLYSLENIYILHKNTSP